MRLTNNIIQLEIIESPFYCSFFGPSENHMYDLSIKVWFMIFQEILMVNRRSSHTCYILQDDHWDFGLFSISAWSLIHFLSKINIFYSQNTFSILLLRFRKAERSQKLFCFARSDGLQTKWFGWFFSKNICIIHFDKLVKLSRMVVIWNLSGHVVALESTYNLYYIGYKGKIHGASGGSRDRPNQVFYSSKWSLIFSSCTPFVRNVSRESLVRHHENFSLLFQVILWFYFKSFTCYKCNKSCNM